MSHLDRILSLERQRTILSSLSPMQLLIVTMIWNGKNSIEIARELNLSKQMVSWYMVDARRRVLRRLPELESVVRDRDLRRGHRWTHYKPEEDHALLPDCDCCDLDS